MVQVDPVRQQGVHILNDHQRQLPSGYYEPTFSPPVGLGQDIYTRFYEGLPFYDDNEGVRIINELNRGFAVQPQLQPPQANVQQTPSTFYDDNQGVRIINELNRQLRQDIIPLAPGTAFMPYANGGATPGGVAQLPPVQQTPPMYDDNEGVRIINELNRQLRQDIIPFAPGAPGVPGAPGAPGQPGAPQAQVTVRPNPQELENKWAAIARAHGINLAAPRPNGYINFNGGKAWLQLDGTIFVERIPVPAAQGGLPGQVEAPYTITGARPQDIDRTRTTPLEFTRLMGALRLQFTPAAPGAPAVRPFTFTSSERAGRTFNWQPDGTFIDDQGKTWRLKADGTAAEEVTLPGAAPPGGGAAPNVPRPILPFTHVLAQVNAHPIRNQDGSYTRVTRVTHPEPAVPPAPGAPPAAPPAAPPPPATDGQLVYIQVSSTDGTGVAQNPSLFASQHGPIMAMTLVPPPPPAAPGVANPRADWIRSDDPILAGQRRPGDTILPATRNINYLHLFLDDQNRLRQARIVANTLDLQTGSGLTATYADANSDGIPDGDTPSSPDNPTHDGVWEIRGNNPSVFFRGGMFEGTTRNDYRVELIPGSNPPRLRLIPQRPNEAGPVLPGEYNYEEFLRRNPNFTPPPGPDGVIRGDGRRISQTTVAPPPVQNAGVQQGLPGTQTAAYTGQTTTPVLDTVALANSINQFLAPYRNDPNYGNYQQALATSAVDTFQTQTRINNDIANYNRIVQGEIQNGHPHFDATINLLNQPSRPAQLFPGTFVGPNGNIITQLTTTTPTGTTPPVINPGNIQPNGGTPRRFG